MTTSVDTATPLPAEPTIGIVCALNLESAPLLERLRPKRTQTGNGLKFYDCALGDIRIVVVEGGVGYSLATQATHALIDALNPAWILSYGLSGALMDEMEIGDLVVGNAFIKQNGLDPIIQSLSLPQVSEQTVQVGKLCTSDHIVRTCHEKRELHARTGAIAVDMESHAVANVCKARKVGFMAIRAISDTLKEDLPKEVLAIFGPKGTIRTGALFGTLIKRPASIKDLWKIREGAVHAAQQLARLTLKILPLLMKSSSK